MDQNTNVYPPNESALSRLLLEIVRDEIIIPIWNERKVAIKEQASDHNTV